MLFPVSNSDLVKVNKWSDHACSVERKAFAISLKTRREQTTTPFTITKIYFQSQQKCLFSLEYNCANKSSQEYLCQEHSIEKITATH